MISYSNIQISLHIIVIFLCYQILQNIYKIQSQTIINPTQERDYEYHDECELSYNIDEIDNMKKEDNHVEDQGNYEELTLPQQLSRETLQYKTVPQLKEICLGKTDLSKQTINKLKKEELIKHLYNYIE